MKFVVYRASNLREEEEIEINTLKELEKFARVEQEKLIITFAGIVPRAWADGQAPRNEIMIYDNYVE